MKACILQHTKEESPGKIEEWLIKRNWKIDFVKLYKDKYVLPDYKKYPGVGRDMHGTTGEIGLAAHWVKHLLHHVFMWKAQLKPGWTLIPE